LFESSPTLVNNVFEDNQAFSASAIRINSCSPNLLQNTIARNPTVSGAAIEVSNFTSPSVALLRNTIVVSNTVGILVNQGATAEMAGVLWFANSVANSQGSGTINIGDAVVGDPAFAPDGYHLQANSAAIDKGINSGITADIDGDPRPEGAGYDLGADEFLMQNGVKAWTLMYYFAADNDMKDKDYFMEKQVTQQQEALKYASTNPNVQIVSLWDHPTGVAEYYTFSNGVVSEISSQGTVHTGRDSTLRNFVTWAQSRYPARHYALIISDHGQGIAGVALDRHLPYIFWWPDGDYLKPSELQKALKDVKKLDLLYMDACLMGTVELGYQLRDLVDFYVASESETWGAAPQHYYVLGLNRNNQQIIPQLAGDTSAEQLATNIAQAFRFVHQDEWHLPSTVSVVRLDRVRNVAEKARALATEITEHMSESL